MKKTTKIMSLVLSVMVILLGSIPISAAEPLIGDVNGDKKVTILDATLIQRYLASDCELSNTQLKAADMNQDGKVSIVDATDIQKHIAGMDSKVLPQETTSTEPETTEPSTVITPTKVETTTAPVEEDCTFNEEKAKEVFNLINAERKKEGKAPLKNSSVLNDVAKVRAKEISTYFSHTRPDGSSCFSVIDGLNIRWKILGENIAGGFNEPSRVMTAWMNSSGHRANILNDSFESVGIACYRYNGNCYWVQFFMSEW